MEKLGIILVSHSKNLAQGIADLVNEVAKEISFTFVGGTEDGEIGTSFERVQAIVEENAADYLLAFYDLGSARMNIELVSELSDKTIAIQSVPVVEGTYTAAALLQAGATKADILKQLSEMHIIK